MAIKGYWKLNGNSNDYSGNGNNGTGYSVSYAPGRLGQSVYFDSYSDYIEIPHISSNYITVSFWIKNVSISSSAVYAMLVHQDGYLRSGVRGWNFWAYDPAPVGNNITIRWNVFNASSSAEPLFSISRTEFSKWNHIVGTFDGTNAIIYLNGVEKQRIALSGTIRQNTDTICIGKRDPGIDSQIGYTDEVIIDNAAWSAANVKNEYARAKGFF